ncbi:AAA family ATPase, partial [Streptomyces pathocidini]|uniref:AAA family ATPase n=1 Tax=Streptomyces pathocidini TaxID=1650571 RepID=UPI00340AC05B
MRLHRLRITAFGPFGATQEVDFDELSSAGLFLLHGPTGAGKTSVLDAVCYALYGGVPGARHGGQSLRSDHAEPFTPTEIVLEFTVGGRRLEVTRRPEQPRPKKRGDGLTREKAQTWLREWTAQAASGATPGATTGSWKALSRSHQEVGEEIGQLLGMSREQFCQVVLLPQGDFARFLRADAEARAHLLGRLFDTRRFAAVEEKLAELRRAAERRVRGGDERLLALAHRMAQAAGRVADHRDHPLPELSPGEPGLADTVLEWAALARTTAREHLDIAGTAVGAAEGDHGRAQRHADASRELAALQRRHAEARRRAADLEERRSDNDRVRARLDRGRAAESVVPTLDLRHAADDAHRMSTATLRATRETLARAWSNTEPPAPPGAAIGGGVALTAAELAEARADRLVGLERELRQELGGLAAARRAEERVGRIGGERAELEREAAVDGEALHEVAAWLERWESERAGRVRRVEDAREAARRAELLDGRLDSVRRRLDAGRRRDRLTAQVAEAQARLLRARERATAAHEHRLDLKERRLRGIAAELAAGLREGHPCAVCGATEHPLPAREQAGHVDRAAEEAARQDHERAERARAEAERAAQTLRESLAGAAAAAGEETTAELAAQADAVERSHREARRAAADLQPATEALARAEEEYERRHSQRQAAERRAVARTSAREALDREQAALEREVAQARGGAGSVAARAALLERRAG